MKKWKVFLLLLVFLLSSSGSVYATPNAVVLLVNSSLQNLATEVSSQPGDLVLTFDGLIQSGTIKLTSAADGSNSSETIGSGFWHQVSGNQITVDLNSLGLKYSTEYILKLNDLNGENTNSFTLNFTTEQFSALTSPPDNATNVDPQVTELVIAFKQDLFMSPSGGSPTVTLNGGNYQNLSLALDLNSNYNSATRTLKVPLNGIALNYNTTYTVHVEGFAWGSTEFMPCPETHSFKTKSSSSNSSSTSNSSLLPVLSPPVILSPVKGDSFFTGEKIPVRFSGGDLTQGGYAELKHIGDDESPEPQVLNALLAYSAAYTYFDGNIPGYYDLLDFTAAFLDGLAQGLDYKAAKQAAASVYEHSTIHRLSSFGVSTDRLPGGEVSGFDLATGMIVQHNLTAANANRNLNLATSNQAEPTEKLSSGYRINRAGDDAAGLSISEKMRSQIRGLDQASKNAQEGISLIQTAEGTLNEVHSILQRLNELATQAANDTNTKVDQGSIQGEMEVLLAEIDRVSLKSGFNLELEKLLDSARINSTSMVTVALSDSRELALSTAGLVPGRYSLTIICGGLRSVAVEVTLRDGTFYLVTPTTSLPGQAIPAQVFTPYPYAAIHYAKAAAGQASDSWVKAGEVPAPDVNGVSTFTLAPIAEPGEYLLRLTVGPAQSSAVAEQFSKLLVRPGYAVQTDAYAFGNPADWPLSSGLTSSDWTQVFGSDWVLKNQFRIEQYTPTGLCFGLGLSSMLVYASGGLQNTLLAEDYPGAANLFALSKPAQNSPLAKFLAQYQILQFGDIISAARVDSEYLLDANGAPTGNQHTLANIAAYARDAENGAAPIIMDITGGWYQDGLFYRNLGHSVVAFGGEEIEAGYRVYVYDPNYPGETRFLYVYPKGRSGTDVGEWYYDQLTTPDGARVVWGSQGTITLPDSTVTNIPCSLRYVDITDVYGQLSTDNLPGLSNQVIVSVETKEDPLNPIVVGSAPTTQKLNLDLTTVSGNRSQLGALQNHLENTILNLDISAENRQSAESRIRDLDMATEMVNYSKNNILQQAGQSMLAQANQSTQGVLSLLGLTPDGRIQPAPFASIMVDAGPITLFKADGSETAGGFHFSMTADESAVTVKTADPTAVAVVDPVTGAISLHAISDQAFTYHFTEVSGDQPVEMEIRGVPKGIISIAPLLVGNTLPSALVYGDFDGEAQIRVTVDGQVVKDETAVLNSGLLVFRDVHPGDWFFEQVYSANGAGVMEGYPDGYFRPQNSLSVAEFITIACRSAGLASFDLPSAEGEAWFLPYIALAEAAGYVSPEDGFYGRWDQEITREEMARVISNLLPIGTSKVDSEIDAPAIPDLAEVNEIYRADVINAYAAGLLMGNDASGYFAPTRTLTRAEAAVVVLRLYAALNV